MLEWRKDIIADNWVIISSERSRGSVDFEFNAAEKKKDRCVFWEGNENETPPEEAAKFLS